MNANTSLRAALVGLCLLASGAAVGAAAAQDSVRTGAVAAAVEEAATSGGGGRAAEVIGRLRTLLDENRRDHARLTSASAEDSLVLRLKLEQNIDAFMETMEELSTVAAATAADDTLLNARIERIYQEVTPRIWALIGELRGEVDILRARRTTTTPAGRSELEDRIIHLTRRLDRVFAFAREHLAALDAVGLDAVAPRATFAALLRERADELGARIDLGLARLDELRGRLKENPGDGDLVLLVTATKKTLDANAASQAATLDLLDDLGLPDPVHRAKLVAVTQDLASGLLDVRVTATLVGRTWSTVTDWLAKNGPKYLVKLFLFLAVVVVGRVLARVVRSIVAKSLDRANLGISQLLRRTIVSSAHNAVFGVAVLVALAQLGISLGPLLAGLGVVGFILGFAMQDSLSNFAAGLMILFYRPYDVGDVVEVGGIFGKVEHMSLVSTSILTFDNQKLVVPNSKIWGDVIKNVTDQKIRRVDMVFGISYSDDIPHAERVLNAILAEHPKVLDEPEPMVRLHTLGESSVDFVVRPWVNTPDYWDVYWDVTREVKMRFDAEGVSIPFPQRDVHLHRADGGNGAEAEA